MSTIKNIYIDQGTNKTIVFTVYNGSTTAGNELNVTGYTATFKVADLTGKVILTFNTSPHVVIGGVDGKITINLIPTDTNTLLFKLDKYSCKYQLDITNTSGKVYRPFSGDFIIENNLLTH